MPGSDPPSRRGVRATWATGLALVLGTLAAVSVPTLAPIDARTWSWLFLLAGAAWAWRESKSLALACDLFVAVTLVWVIAGDSTAKDPALRLHLLAVSVLAVLGCHLSSWAALILAWGGAVAWLALGVRTPVAEFGWTHWWVLASSLAMLAVFSSVVLANRGQPRRCVDVILSSGSGNTAHLAYEFAQGIRSAGSEVRVHRFGHYPAFRPELEGDALVVAFPVYGCKPPWPLLVYLLRELPRGRGKPAFILYTCVGGAENAGVFCWLLLTLKGYRVAGRTWGVYPLNVPTFRLGTTRAWQRIDRLLPRSSEVRSVRAAGDRFARGGPAGLPFVFCLSPGFVVGIALDNKWLDRLLYRNHVIQKRCDHCGLCVACCPMDRIRFVEGKPRGRGACMICMACVNICPTCAMHLWCWTEYGVQYRPRFRRLVLRSPAGLQEGPREAGRTGRAEGGP